MKKNHVISKFRFLQYGKQAPKNSRFKGIITTGSLIGWLDYTKRSEAANIKEEKTMHKDTGLIGYTSRDGKTSTYSSMGWIDSAKKMKSFKKEIAQAFSKDGNLCWDTVVSMKDYKDSFANGLYNVKDYAAILDKVLPDYFKSVGFIPENMIWWMNYHDNKTHPHMHIVFMEKKQLRTKGALSEKQINRYKQKFLKEFGLREELAKRTGMDRKEVFKLLDESRNQLIQDVTTIVQEEKILNSLYAKLPKDGRLSYNSLHMKPFRQEINNIIDYLLQSDIVKESYEKWMQTVDVLHNTQNDMLHTDSSTFKQTELQKIYTKIGNAILKHYKNSVVDLQSASVIIPEDCMVIDHNNVHIIFPGEQMEVEMPIDYINKNHLELDQRKCKVKLRSENEYIQLKDLKSIVDAMKEGIIPGTNINWNHPGESKLIFVDNKEVIHKIEDYYVIRFPKIDETFKVPEKDTFSFSKGLLIELNGNRYIVSDLIGNEKCKVSKEEVFSSYDHDNIRYARKVLQQMRGKTKHPFFKSRYEKKVRKPNQGLLNLKKMAMRTVHQDIHEKEKDLEKFIRMEEEKGEKEL